MPLLNNGRLLFIHVPKNAGKSIEHAFGLSERSGSRSLLNKFAKLLLNKTSNDSARNQLHGSYDYTFSSQHFTFKEIVNLGLLDLNALNNITTLSVVRNPYDRAVSSVLHYHYNNIAENGIVIKNPNEFERALREWVNASPSNHNEIAHMRQQHEFLTFDKPSIEIDNILRYEFLELDFHKFVNKMNLDHRGLVWRGKNRESRDYRGYYNNSSKKLIEQRFGEDFELLKYRFK